MRFQSTLPLLLAGMASASFAQTHFCIAGDLDSLNVTQVSECKTKMTNVREAVRRHGAPGGWHFVVVCDESGWTDYSSFIAAGTPSVAEAAFHTDSDLHWTFIRGSRMDADSAEGADQLLAVALKGVHSPKTAPMPNPQKVRREPVLSVARVERPHLP